MASLTVCLKRLAKAGASERDLAMLRGATEDYRAGGHADAPVRAAREWQDLLREERAEVVEEIRAAAQAAGKDPERFVELRRETTGVVASEAGVGGQQPGDLAEPPHYAELRAEKKRYFQDEITPAVHAVLQAVARVGRDTLERNKIIAPGKSVTEWLMDFVDQKSAWTRDGKNMLKSKETGIQYLSKKDLWPTDDGSGETLRKATLKAVRTLKNAPGYSPDEVHALGSTTRAIDLLPGVAPRDEGAQALRDAEVARAAKQQDAPGPEGFTLTGSDRPADELAARGQQGLFDQDAPGPGTLSANPFSAPVRAVFGGLKRAPGRAATGGVAGGAIGGVSSDEEVGSAGWWRDVAAGAVAGAAATAALHGSGVAGRGGIVSAWQRRLGQAVDKLPGIGRGPDELIVAKEEQRALEQVLDRKTAEIGRFLADHFSPAERGQIADLIEGRGIVRDFNLVHRQAAALDDYLSQVGEEMKALGMLSEDAELGGYLHRYYAKHLGLDGNFKKAKRQQGLTGSYSIRRGTVESFEQPYLSPGARQVADQLQEAQQGLDKVQREMRAWERKLARGSDDEDQLLDQYQEAMARLNDEAEEWKGAIKDLSRVELREMTGTQNGELRRFLFAADEVGRVDNGLAPILARKDRPGPGLDPRAMPEAPGVSDLAPTDRLWTLDGVKGKEVVAHRDWTKAERTAWGEIGDAGYRFVRGMAEVSHDLNLARLWQRVASRGDWARAAADAPEDWVRVPTTTVHPKSKLRKYGALSGMAVRPDVWAGIRNYGRSPMGNSAAARIYRNALNRWKAWHTLYNPVTHVNNTYSNFEMLYLGGYGPGDFARGLTEISKGEQSALYREARDAGMFGTDWSSSLLGANEGGGKEALERLAKELREQPEIPDAVLSTGALTRFKEWWVQSRASVAEADGAWASGAAIAKALQDPVMGTLRGFKRPVDAAARAMRRAYRFEDEAFKMAAFVAERRKGRTPAEAVREAQRLFFDYADLPEAVKWVRDFPIGSPFISYTYKAIPAVVRNAVENPERVLALIAGYEAMNYGGMLLDEREPGMAPGEYWATSAAEERLRPSWDRGRTLWGARNTVNLPYPEGYALALGRAHAVGNPFVAEGGGPDKPAAMPEALSFWGPDVMGGNPAVRVLWDIATGLDWKGKPIYEKGDDFDVRLRKSLNYAYQAIAPSNPWTPGSYSQQKIIEGLANEKRQAEAAGEEPNALVASIVDGANAVSEALGGQQFTGLSRGGDEVVTRDALLGSVGVKLRPQDLTRGADFARRDIKREREEGKAAAKRQFRLGAEGRITPAQEEAARQRLDALFQRTQRKMDAVNDAEALVTRQGRQGRQ